MYDIHVMIYMNYEEKRRGEGDRGEKKGSRGENKIAILNTHTVADTHNPVISPN